jgi:hypothetical protein
MHPRRINDLRRHPVACGFEIGPNACGRTRTRLKFVPPRWRHCQGIKDECHASRERPAILESLCSDPRDRVPRSSTLSEYFRPFTRPNLNKNKCTPPSKSHERKVCFDPATVPRREDIPTLTDHAID